MRKGFRYAKHACVLNIDTLLCFLDDALMFSEFVFIINVFSLAFILFMYLLALLLCRLMGRFLMEIRLSALSLPCRKLFRIVLMKIRLSASKSALSGAFWRFQ